ncbi:MAG TPA: carboxypeptidase-like regulatory domain-containing protein [Vicinamibacterales bacterium]|nr:carboxypeptidase-like regulatory domain-containing protein [Vicinamibacterales bacterium]
MFTLAAIILALALQESPHSPSSGGSLVGCASDAMAQRLPGVAVVAKSGRVQLTATADAGGCYELKDLPSGSYRVTARLPGFDNVTRDGLNIVTGSVARLDFAMRVSAICECVRLGGTTLAEQWGHADAVLHVRLSASESQPTTPVGYYRHVATVIDALKKPAVPLRAPVSVLQNQRSAAPGPYDIDQELVLFLKTWRSSEFMITNDEPGLAVPTGSSDPAIAFLIQNGHIRRAPPEFSRYVGMPLGAFLDELRALSRGK